VLGTPPEVLGRPPAEVLLMSLPEVLERPPPEVLGRPPAEVLLMSLPEVLGMSRLTMLRTSRREMVAPRTRR